MAVILLGGASGKNVDDGDRYTWEAGKGQPVAATVGRDGGPGAFGLRAAVDEYGFVFDIDDQILRDAIFGVERRLPIAVPV
jgi:hypothetical protein